MEHKGTVVLHTERMLLRPFTTADAQAVFDNWASDDEVTKYLTWPTHSDVSVSRGYMEYCVRGYEAEDTYQWGIVLKDSGLLIGNISAVRVEEAVGGVELGWVIGRRWWGCGYMAEAARRVIAFFFEEVGANRVSARHDPNNPNSGRVMYKAGMRYEGTLRSCDRNNQGIVDCAYYSILRSEYQPSQVLTRRLRLYPVSNAFMEQLIEEEADPEMRQAYGEMLRGCLEHPGQRIWSAVWVMEQREQPGTIVGDFCFKGLNPDGMVEIGYGLREGFCHKGFMTEAVAAICPWALAQSGVTRVEAEAEQGNAASMAVLSRTGFLPTGQLGEEGPRYVWQGYSVSRK